MTNVKIIVPKIADDKTSSYFYDDTIAHAGNLLLIANGEVKLNCHHKPTNDKEVAKCYENDHFSLNNWFEVIDAVSGDPVGDVAGSYDEGIDALKWAIDNN